MNFCDCGNVLTNGECDDCVGNKFRELENMCPTCQAESEAEEESDSEDEYSRSVGDCVFCGSILTKHGDCKNCNFEVDCKNCGIPHSRDFALCLECRCKDDESEEESDAEAEESDAEESAEAEESEKPTHAVFWYNIITMAMRALMRE